ncbi:pheophytinase, chloroplastic-like [Phalaenopsis equestris]|uniref:pheophytinase, chloroplastic-like n=1 Tax=Phalaenopsis equestris TaxID=78828 RepID=UPI0009E24282|nr:pheophytinase, chloroplastic-like [Phalaenopsis equestris]
MELLPLNHPLPCDFCSSNVKLLENRISLKQSKFFHCGKRKISSSATKSFFSQRKSHQPSYEINNLNEKEGNKLLSILEGLDNQNSIMTGDGTCNYHVVDGNLRLKKVPKIDQTEKIVIPTLPNDSNGNHGSQISSCYWEWKPKFSVHYEKSGTKNINAPAVLFLPGFGVGAFHYEKQLKDLGRDYRVWAVDFLGQGMSLPSEDPAPCTHNTNSEEPLTRWGFGNESEPWASELVYSVDLWRDQVQHFVELVIGEPVYVVGNSLGGFVAMYFAACNPQLVKGVTLLNATPFWGFLPNPIRSPGWSRVFPWAGTFPLPLSVRRLTELM